MTLPGRITWRGITLGTGSTAGITAVEGWEDLPPLEDHSEPLVLADGEDVGELVAGARTVTVTGYVYDADAGAGLVAALQRETGRRRGLDTLVVEQFGRTLTAEARIVRRSLPQARGYGSGWQPWALQWKCPDPLRYVPGAGDRAVGLPSATGGRTLPLSLPTALGQQASSGRVELANTGDAGYRPELAVRGPLPNGFEVTHLETGRRLVYPEAIPAGIALTIDRRRRVRLAGVDRRGALTVAEWPEVPPGGATLAWSSLGADTDPAAELRVVAPPAGALW